MTTGPPRIFDRGAIGRARARAERIGGDMFLLREAAEGLSERLTAVRRKFRRAADIDSRSGARDILMPHAESWTHVPLDEREALDLTAESLDLVTSVLALHVINDLPGLLAQVRRALKPDGLFIAAMFSGATLSELRASLAAAEIETRGGISPRVAPFADVRDLGGLLQRAGFALPVADIERTTVRYRDFATLVRDLRASGESNVLVERQRKPMSRALLTASSAHYEHQHRDDDGRLRATFEIAYLTGWAPDASQQRPLRPGAAQVRLADALGVTEHSAGEAAAAPKRQD